MEATLTVRDGGRVTPEEEFRVFVAARTPALLRTSYLLSGGDWALAEDLLQTALTKAFLSWGRIDDKGAAEAYVRRTLATTAASWWRRKWHGERPTGVLPDVGVDRGQPFDERDALWQHVRLLPAKQRAVLVLRFYEDLSEAEVARTLGIAPGTAKSTTSRALAALRVSLGEQP
jgi:RNA polymerase sigma-70 factor (ECF subfamily)